MGMVTLRQLRYFEALARHRHFGKAAEDCAISQPALSMQIRELEQSLGGIKTMRKLPDAIFVIDPKQEEIAVKEARKLGVPVIAVIDSNCDPDMIDYKVPGNDDAIRAIRLFCQAIAEAVIEGRTIYEQSLVKEKVDDRPTGDAASAAVGAAGGV